MSRNNIADALQRFEVILQRILDEADIPAQGLRDAIAWSLFPGGKRLRPCLVYLSGQVTGVHPDCLDLIAASIELTHCYSLVHDDLPAMDNDDFRRGKASCHRAFDEATAILVGDGLQALAIDLLLTRLPAFLEPAQVIAVTRELVQASGPAGMVSGQSLDLSDLSRPDVNEAQLRMIHLLKTGKLISACVNMVLAASNTDETRSNALKQYAAHLGLVFQMQDDYLDAYAPESLGKGQSSDRANQKTTFASLYTQSQLLDLITHHFNQVANALAPLQAQAVDLLTLSQSMQKRGNKT